MKSRTGRSIGRAALLVGVALVWAGLPARADLLAGAAEALRDGVPAVAIEKLGLALASPLPPEEREVAAARLAECLLASHRPEEALAAASGIAGEPAALTRARALLALGRWGEAEETLRPFSSREALADRAEALHRAGRNAEAIDLLTGLDLDITGRLRLAAYRLVAGDFDGAERELRTAEPEARRDRQQARYLAARLDLARGRDAEAQSGFEALAWESAQMPEPLRAAVAIGLSSARERLGGPETADVPVEEFISQNPASRHLPEAFARLDELYSRQEDPPEAALEKWAADEPPGRAAYARFYLALSDLRQDRADRGLERLAEFSRLFPEHPLAARAHLEAGRTLAATGEREAALAELETAMRKAKTPDLLAEIEIASGSVQFWAGEYLLAASHFKNAADRSRTWREEALYYSALAWSNMGNAGRFEQDYRALGEVAPGGWRQQTLLLELGLSQARRGDPSAGETLRRFLDAHPQHPHAAEAMVALAELAFLATPPRVEETLAYLLTASDADPPSDTLERAEALLVYAADAPDARDEEKILSLGLAFLERHPASPLRAEIRMKLGQVLFRRGDYAAAQVQFLFLSKEQPESPLAETALYLAGESALRSLNSQGLGASLSLFAAVAKNEKSPLAPYARLQQAVAQSRLGNPKEANILFDALLEKPAEPEVRFAAMTGKADNLMALGESDPAQLEAARALYEKIAAEPDATPFWKHQALYKIARCQQKAGDPGRALATLYDLVAGRDPTAPEFYWYYRAGFDAAQMIEEKGDWASAIGLYKKIASLPGPRAAEAAEHARRIRLEHFVWEE